MPQPQAPEPQPEPEALPAEREPEPEPEASRVTLMALGDNLIHNTVYWSAELPDGGYDFTPFYAAIAPVVSQYDIACINQETILVDDPAVYANYPNFGSPTQVADALAKTGFSVVTGATNHCFDKGETGILDTCRYWRDHYPDITTLGIHDSEEDANRLRVIEKNGIRIALLNYTYGLNGGADLIIGGHPHVVQPARVLMAEDGREVPVFYSLGNFLSHQTQAQNMLGGMASVTICKDEAGAYVEHYELLPTVNLITKNPDTGWYHYAPMLLSDYTPELAATHHIAGCSVEAMQTLFDQIVSGT